MAVYTEVPDDEVESFLTEYDIGEVLSLKGIAEGVENSNYILHTTAGNYILTLYEKRVKKEDLPFFLGYMQHLAAQGISCPVPIAGKDGEFLRTLCGRPAAITAFLDGMWPRRIQPFHCRALGKTMAEMHLAGANFPLERPNSLSVSGWEQLLEACEGKGDQVKPGLTRELEQELTFLSANWPDSLPKGVIHADMFQDNVFFIHENLSGVIDFYFACNDVLAYEIAICLNAWCFEQDNSFNVTKAQLMTRAYQETKPLTREELEALPILARGAAFRFLLTRLYDWINHPAGAFVKPKDPLEYLNKLRFHQSVKSVSDYGITL
ncbi:homoserine kinase [Kiloniella laminariae]|uniref:Homoserine kinase n=1 Tax=Kiloniella laminariae TaxID=454162 RepID=A0ABT4LL19_9PROT|nr:homoserine kinase [Kiloniella laminariae]MCZ4281795.1 homoserine kinase [Kiloniella laminariae]